jgi:hypothetical protein
VNNIKMDLMTKICVSVNLFRFMSNRKKALILAVNKSLLKDVILICDLLQISSMVQRLDCWCKDVNSMELLLETRAHEFLTL